MLLEVTPSLYFIIFYSKSTNMAVVRTSEVGVPLEPLPL